jgi:hypothetical protein
VGLNRQGGLTPDMIEIRGEVINNPREKYYDEKHSIVI